MNKKMTLLAGAISSVLGGAAFAGIDDIVITEYVEGTGNNKAVEISNLHATDAYTFDGTLGLYYSSYKNLIENPAGANVLTGATIPAGESIVIINGEANSDVARYVERLSGREDASIIAGTYDEVSHSAMNFNGDDAVWLGNTDGEEGSVEDIFGIYGHGSSGGKLWENQTMRRKAPASQKSTYDAADWNLHAVDSFGGLGHPTNVDDSELPAPPVDPVPQPCTDADASVLNVTIGEVQGTGKSSPLLPSGEYTSTDLYAVTGTVSAVTLYPASGFYLYDENADGEALSSDGIFVPTKTATQDMIGQKVCVVAKVNENFGLTQLLAEDDKWEVVDATSVPVTPVPMVVLESDEDFQATLERYEGMLIRTVQDMDSSESGDQNIRVSRSFSFNYDSYRNNITLAYKRPNPQPNQDHVAGSPESYAQADQNDEYRILLESDGHYEEKDGEQVKITKAPNGQIPYYPQFNKNPQDNYIRIDDSVVDLTGVVSYSYGEFNITVPYALETQNSNELNFVHNTDRSDAPDLEESYDGGFTIKVATQNVLNYFNSPFGGTDNRFGDNRGAESEQEFERQQAKLVEAIYGLDADILGLMEVENNGFGDFSAIKELLAAVNAKYTEDRYSDRDEQDSIHNRYVFVGFDKNGDLVLDENDTIGSDVITTGVIYRPSKVSVVSGQVITMPVQDAPMIVKEDGSPIVDSKGEIRENGDNYHRNSVAAKFSVLNTGKELTVVINHLKSKGSTCYEDWVGWQEWDDFDPEKDDVQNLDFQGNCENFRVAAAVRLGDELGQLGGDQVVLGDFNAYAHEDPMLVMTSNPTGKELKAAGYTYVDGDPQFGPSGQVITKTYGYLNAMDLVKEEGETSWSYSYNDEVGSLDHLLISPSLENRLVDAADWHINAPETSLFDYGNEYKYATDDDKNPIDQEGNVLPADDVNVFYAETPFRSSDHDSAIVSLGYKFNEGGETPVKIAVKSGRADIGFPVSANARDGDIAEISISPRPVNVALPKVELTKDGAQTVLFDVVGLETGTYTFTMTLKGDASARSASSTSVIESQTFTADLVKRDSSNVTPVAPEYDGSGGSFGFGALLSLLGFGFLRRRR